MAERLVGLVVTTAVLAAILGSSGTMAPSRTVAVAAAQGQPRGGAARARASTGQRANRFLRRVAAWRHLPDRRHRVGPRQRRDDSAQRLGQGRHGEAFVEGRPGSQLPAHRRAATRALSVADRRRARQGQSDAPLLSLRRQHPQLPADLHGRPRSIRGSEPDLVRRFDRPLGWRHAGRSTRSGSTTSSGSISSGIRIPRSCTPSSATRAPISGR